MPEPVEIIAAGAAVVGAVQGVATAATGSSGVNVSQCHLQYPREFAPQQFAHAGQSVQWDIIKFVAHGGFWDNDLAVSATGYVSNDNGPVVGRPDSQHPNVPVNRFVLLTLDKSSHSEDMSWGLLNVNIGLWGGGGDVALPEGTAEAPWVALHVHGRFDPVGPGDMEFGFKLLISSFAQIHLSDETWSGSVFDNFSIKNQGDHVLVYLN